MSAAAAHNLLTSAMYQPLRDSMAEYLTTTDAPSIEGFRAWQGHSVMTDAAITVLIEASA